MIICYSNRKRTQSHPACISLVCVPLLLPGYLPACISPGWSSRLDSLLQLVSPTSQPVPFSSQNALHIHACHMQPSSFTHTHTHHRHHAHHHWFPAQPGSLSDFTWEYTSQIHSLCYQIEILSPFQDQENCSLVSFVPLSLKPINRSSQSVLAPQP